MYTLIIIQSACSEIFQFSDLCLIIRFACRWLRVTPWCCWRPSLRVSLRRPLRECLICSLVSLEGHSSALLPSCLTKPFHREGSALDLTRDALSLLKTWVQLNSSSFKLWMFALWVMRNPSNIYWEILVIQCMVHIGKHPVPLNLCHC